MTRLLAFTFLLALLLPSWAFAGGILTPAANPPSGLTPAQFQAVKRGYLRPEALVKFMESAINSAPFNKSTGLSASNWTMTIKMEMEAPFWAVRLLGINRAANAIGPITALVGVTESDGTGTSLLLSTPTISGTSYAQLQPATTVNGFRAITWAAAANITIPAATTAQQFVLSDLIAIGSVARAGGQPSTRPFLLWRSWLPGVTTNWAFIGTAGLVNIRTASAAFRNRIIQISSSGTDAVGTPATSQSIGNTMMEVYPVVSFTAPVLSVWGVGDSITSGSAIVTDTVSTWGYRACLDASTPATPCVWANLGMVSQTSATYWANAKAMLVAGVPPPSVLVIGPSSVNDDGGTYTQAILQTARELATDVLRTASKYDIPYVIFWPLLPHNTLNAASDLLRVQLNTEIAAMASSYGIGLVTGLSPLGDGAAPESWVGAYNFAADGVHPTEAAMDTILAPALTTILRGLIN